MTDAKERCALLQDVDKRTFVRFSQYAYTEDYIAADPDILFDSFTVTFTHPVPNETPVDIDDEEALSPPPSAPDYAQPEPELEPTRDWPMSENDKQKWRNLEKNGR